MLYKVVSEKTLDQLGADLEDACRRHQFGVLGMHDLKEKMAAKGVTLDSACRVYEVCNPHQAQKALHAAMDISTALPCRISIYQQGDQLILATLRPTTLLALFNKPGLAEMAGQIEETLKKIMNEAAS